MTSDFLMKILTVEYLLLFAFCLWEGTYPRAMYWFGAAILTVSVLWGTSLK